MARINNVDQALLLLREQLQRSERSGPAARKRRSGAAREASPRPIDRVRALAALDTLSDDDVKRALVRGLLADQLGDGVTNDARFQQVVDEVVRMLLDAPEGRTLLDGALEQLRAGNTTT